MGNRAMGQMRFVYTAHALARLAERTILLGSVEYTVLHPDSARGDRRDPAVCVTTRNLSPWVRLTVWSRLKAERAGEQTCVVISARCERLGAGRWDRGRAGRQRFRFDAQADALYIRLRAGKVVRTRQVGVDYNVDYGRAGQIVGVEVLFAAQKLASGKMDAEKLRRGARPARRMFGSALRRTTLSP